MVVVAVDVDLMVELLVEADLMTLGRAFGSSFAQLQIVGSAAFAVVVAFEFELEASFHGGCCHSSVIYV